MKIFISTLIIATIIFSLNSIHPSKKHVNWQIVLLAHDSGHSYQEVKDYCYESLIKGQECYLLDNK